MRLLGCAAVLLVGSFIAAPCSAASIPAWLDESITTWNEKHPEPQIAFVDIKDSFVWYKIKRTPELGHKEIRNLTYKLVQDKGYVTADDEERVTPWRPPSTGGPAGQKKCWSRSFVLDIQALGNTTAVDGEHSGIRQRMLTCLFCDDGAYWMAGFRTAE